ncbi:glycine oxidase ThiO [Corynebacterium hindlerae]|uniref:glycine oxidase n=1 Tax=Corynebacterium hindlerae TaxID=699041 RepID=A0A7G5FC93_9CORY|nr:glycine oxidase ThiO [Corynebacterium hindlerae]QMV84234.1 glycine oxidase ThiO [Corynebacterium hindlerae]
MHIAVIGAGIVGLCTAWELRQRGHTVTVYDPEPVSEASFAAAGMLAPVSEVVWDQPTLYPLMQQSKELYPEFAQRVAEASGMDIGYLTSETLVCAGDPADRVTLTELVELQEHIGQVAPISSRQARSMEPGLGPGVVGAVHIPGDHQIDPRKFCAALLHLLGPDVVREKVTSLELDADHVVVAAGLRSCEIAGVPQLPLRPVYGDVLRLEVPEYLQPLVTRTVRGVVRGRPVYVVPRADGSLVLGATSREDGPGVSAEGVHQLLRDAHHLIPGIWECSITEMTCRARPGSPDDVPMIGRISERATVSTGYFRHGILLSVIGAKLTTDVVLGVPVPEATAAAIDPFRFNKGA